MSLRSWRRSEAQCATLEEARQARWETAPLGIIQSTVQFSFAVIIHRVRYLQTFQIMSDSNIIVPDEKTYCRAQSPLCQAIVEFAFESCRKW
jgi:hypothetical protein